MAAARALLNIYSAELPYQAKFALLLEQLNKGTRRHQSCSLSLEIILWCLFHHQVGHNHCFPMGRWIHYLKVQLCGYIQQWWFWRTRVVFDNSHYSGWYAYLYLNGKDGGTINLKFDNYLVLSTLKEQPSCCLCSWTVGQKRLNEYRQNFMLFLVC